MNGARVSDNERFSVVPLACGMSKCCVRTFMNMWDRTQWPANVTRSEVVSS